MDSNHRTRCFFRFSFGENGFGLSGSLRNRKHICWLNRINRCIEHTIWIDKKIIIEELLWPALSSPEFITEPSTKQKIKFRFSSQRRENSVHALEGKIIEIQMQ